MSGKISEGPADRLKAARIAAGFDTAHAAAKFMGVGQPTYSRHETGVRAIDPTTAVDYARHFGVTPEHLLFGAAGAVGGQPDATTKAPAQLGHHLREWRGNRTLQEVADQVERLAQDDRFRRSNGSRVSMTHATLSRIERGLLPYSEQLLEILAEIYATTPSELIAGAPGERLAAADRLSVRDHGWHVVAWLEYRGVRQADLQREMGWPKAKASDIVSGKQRYNQDILNELASVLDASPSELLLRPAEAMAIRRLRSMASEISGLAKDLR
jgi:transcriptional regulator with XRE-family HTH domain